MDRNNIAITCVFIKREMAVSVAKTVSLLWGFGRYYIHRSDKEERLEVMERKKIKCQV